MDKGEYVLEKQLDECERIFRNFVHAWIEKNWGKRCPDYEKECPLCKAWDCFGYLFQEENDDGQSKAKEDK